MNGHLLVGLDLGATQIKLAAVDPLKGIGNPLLTLCRPNRGDPRRVAEEMLRETTISLGSGCFFRLGMTGVSAALLSKAKTGIPSLAINQLVAAVCAVTTEYHAVRTIVDLGGQFSKWILVRGGQEGRPTEIEEFAMNGLCAAGSGVFLEQQARRLGLSVQELGLIAAKAGRGASIGGRCSVFAKSDMIHLQQKGAPLDEITYGLCLALAGTFTATVLEQRKIEPPVALIGGGAANPGLIRALCSLLKLHEDLFIIPDRHLYSSALGSAQLAMNAQEIEAKDLLVSLGPKKIPSVCRKEPPVSTSALLPLERQEGQTARPEHGAFLVQGPIGVHLGVDIGSVSTTVVLLADDLSYFDGVYIATAGNPLSALNKAMGIIEDRHGGNLKVLSAGSTGSGRHLAERLFGMDLVKNEITTQMTAAIHFVPEVETVFEIGGQDAKFISIRDGLLQDFEMNKICSAGTGSFLEEQAERLGVSIIGEFSERAFSGKTPVDLGSCCTVFMDTELCSALAGNTVVGDVCAGLAYAVARNYLEKVVSGRKLGKTIVFQGGTSANEAVVSAFVRILGRPLIVHPYSRLSGAIGAALLASRYMAGQADKTSEFKGLSACREYARSSFECGKCENYCRINRITVGKTHVHFGDACDRYSALDGREYGRPAHGISPASTDLFARRKDLLTAHLPKHHATGRPRIGLLRGSLMQEYLPFWAHLLDELGIEVVLSPPLGRYWENGTAGLPAAICLPLKLAGAQIHELLQQKNMEKVLVPSILELESCQPGDRSHTCIYSQQFPDMLAPFCGGAIISPQMGISGRWNLRREGNRELANCLGTSTRSINRAWKRAMEVQASFIAARQELGKEVLESLTGKAVVVIGKPYNLHDPLANLNLARHLLRLGLTSIPMDLLPVSAECLSNDWYMIPWLLNLHQVRALQILASRSDLYPIHVSNCGCGPDAFTLKHLESDWGGRPRLFLEFDSHRGETGLITRLEAFADELHHHRAGVGKTSGNGQTTRNKRTGRPTPGTTCYLPYTSEHVHVYAGMLRRVGYTPRIMDPPNRETVRLGEQFSSGRECHPYVLITGDLVKLVKHIELSPGDQFYIPGTRLNCLLSQFGDGLRHVLDELREMRLQIFDQHPGEAEAMFGIRGMIDLYKGLTIVDYLIIAACRLRPYEAKCGLINQALAICCQDVQDTIAVQSDSRDCLIRCLSRLQEAPLTEEARKPLVGVTGDLYTRMNASGNGDLFAKLEAMGCEVWPSPFFAASTDFELPQEACRWQDRGRLDKSLPTAATALYLRARSRRLAQCLDPEFADHCVEPAQAVLQSYALSYVHANSNHLVRSIVAKMVDFAKRGADGVISAMGLHCMAGTAAEASIPEIRRDHGNLPIISVTYGAKEGPTQTLQIDTFIHQVKNRHRQRKRAETTGKPLTKTADLSRIIINLPEKSNRELKR